MKKNKQKKIRLLLVDDHPIVLEGIKSHLAAQADFEVVGDAADGEEAIRKAGRLLPDIILMDLWIPEIGGEQAIHLMKNNKETQHIPAVLFSANAEIEEICRRSNANGFLKKPFDVSALKKIIEENIKVPSGSLVK